MAEPLVCVEDVCVQLESRVAIVEGVSFSVSEGEILGLVGESGSGKTTLALALLGFALAGVKSPTGSIRIAGEELVGRPERELRQLRAELVAYVPQNPGSSLNPSIRIGDQIAELVRLRVGRGRVDDEVAEAFRSVHLPSDREFLRRFPHQLSGGQQQRACIAGALARRPRLVVLDEPTTGLDVITQARILEEVARLRRDFGIAMVYVSHDLAVINAVVDRIAVMYSGRVVEDGFRDEVLLSPRHPYTKGLLESVPDHLVPRSLRGIAGIPPDPGSRPPGCAFAPRCELRVDRCDLKVPSLVKLTTSHGVRCLEWARVTPINFASPTAGRAEGTQRDSALLAVSSLQAEYRGRSGNIAALKGVTFTVQEGQSLAVVGESGSGKTTLASCVAGVHLLSAGEIRLKGERLRPLARNRSPEQRRSIQIVFQNPYETLNPRHSVFEAISRPARLLRGIGRKEARLYVAQLLEEVRLPARTLERYPQELSGGERQRVAIARALAAEPDLLICDEITSALDVSVQAVVLELLADLRTRRRLALLFISHDLGVVASVSDDVLVMENGAVCEAGKVIDVLARPSTEYTKSLLLSAPRLALGKEQPSGETGAPVLGAST